MIGWSSTNRDAVGVGPGALLEKIFGEGNLEGAKTNFPGDGVIKRAEGARKKFSIFC